MPNGGADSAISARKIFDGQQLLQDHCLLLRGEKIHALLPAADIPSTTQQLELGNGILAPGFIDLQVNGGGDLMFNASPSRATLDTITSAHRNSGTTGLLPTLLSDNPGVQDAAVEAVKAARSAGNKSVLGIHLEGPFFNPARRGAHSEDQLRSPGAEDIAWLCSLAELTTLITLAPEQADSAQIRQLAGSGLHLCAGHTNASYEEIEEAVASGIGGVTHIFNAMSPLQGRQPGAVGAALEMDALWAGIIADGHHVHPAAIRLAHRAKPQGKLILVSDAMATVGGASDTIEIFGETITLRDGRLNNAEGKLAGSAIGMIDAVSYAHRVAGLPLEDCLRMASLYPAAIIGMQNCIGRLTPGLRADLVYFDDDFVVHNTWVAGAMAQHTT